MQLISGIQAELAGQHVTLLFTMAEDPTRRSSSTAGGGRSGGWTACSSWTCR